MNLLNPDELSLMEGLHSTPARRYLSDAPISEAILWNIIDAAIRGPSGGNNQQWAWIVVRDKEVKNKIAEWYRKGWESAYGVRKNNIMDKTDKSDKLGPHNYLSAEHLAYHIQDAPVWIIPVLRNAANSKNPRSGSSIYGAIQHLMLAARAYGIGSTLTTLYSGHEEELKKLINIPEDAMSMALIPLGFPTKGKWAQPKRQSVEHVTFWETWDNLKEFES